MRIGIINGPNLNLLGKREPDIYGPQSFDDYLEELKKSFSSMTLSYFQSNHEGEIVDKIQHWGESLDGLIINPAAYSHTSVAIRDALAAVNVPIVEVHISNIFKREEFRHHSYVTPVSVGVISGLGLTGYKLAIQYLSER